MKSRARARWKGSSLRRAAVVNALALSVAIPAFGYSIFTDAPREYAHSMGDMFAGASASLTAQVPANPINTLVAQLSEKEARLNEREAALAESLAKGDSLGTLSDNLGLISFGISMVLFVLIGANFYMDRQYRRKFSQGNLFVNLRSSRSR